MSVTANEEHSLKGSSAPATNLAVPEERGSHVLGTTTGDDSPATSSGCAGGTGGGAIYYRRTHSQTITINNTTVPGTLLKVIPLDATLAADPSRFLKFKIKSLRISFTFASALGQSAGSFLVGSCPDPANIIPGDSLTKAIDYMSALPGTSMVTPRAGTTLELDIGPEFKYVRQDATVRLSSFGNVYIVALTASPIDTNASVWEMFTSVTIEYKDAALITRASMATAVVPQLFKLDGGGNVAYTTIDTPIGQMFALQAHDDLKAVPEGTTTRTVGLPPMVILKLKTDESDSVEQQLTLSLESGALYSDGGERFVCFAVVANAIGQYSIIGEPTFVLDRPWAEIAGFLYSITSQVLGAMIPLQAMIGSIIRKGTKLATLKTSSKIVL